MKLLHVTVAVMLSAAFAVPAFARSGTAEVSGAALEALQGDAVKAGATDAERVTYWNTMPPDRQQVWQQHCAYTASDAANAQKDTAERQAFCKAMPSK